MTRKDALALFEARLPDLLAGWAEHPETVEELDNDIEIAIGDVIRAVDREENPGDAIYHVRELIKEKYPR